MGFNNPIKVVLNEAGVLYPNKHISCTISIGAGQAETIDIRHHLPWFKKKLFHVVPLDTIRAVLAIATNCEADADDAYRILQARFLDKVDDCYVRLNVDRGLQSIRLDKWERLGDVKALTDDYLRGPEVRAKARRAVKAMPVREVTVSSPTLGKFIVRLISM